MNTGADLEELNKDPPARDSCMECGETSDSIKRCTTCKNAFYCSRACQTKAWKQHKLDCSLLPIGWMSYPAKMNPVEYRELDDAIRHIATVLNIYTQTLIATTILGENSNPPSVDYPSNKLIRDISLPAKYSFIDYTPPIPGDPFRTQIVRIIRLFAIHWVAWMSDDNTLDIECIRQRLSSSLASILFKEYQRSTLLWLPKVLCHPDELSPMEYAALPRMMVVISMQGSRGIPAPRPDIDEVERAYDMRYVNLATIASGFFPR